MATSEMYSINMYTFEYVQQEEFLAPLNNFRIKIYGIGTTSPFGKINYLHNILDGEALRDFD